MRNTSGPNDVCRGAPTFLPCSVCVLSRAHLSGGAVKTAHGITLHLCDVPGALALSVKYIFASILGDLLYHLAQFNAFAARKRSLLTLHNETDSGTEHQRDNARIIRRCKMATKKTGWSWNELRLVFLWIKIFARLQWRCARVWYESTRGIIIAIVIRHSARAIRTC